MPSHTPRPIGASPTCVWPWPSVCPGCLSGASRCAAPVTSGKCCRTTSSSWNSVCPTPFPISRRPSPSPLASLIVMFVISWPVASAALAVVLLSVVLVAWGVARSAGVAESESGIKEHLNTAVISFLRGMKVIRGFLPGKTSFAATDDAIAASEQIENTKMQRGKWQAVASTVLTTSAVLFVLPTGLWCVHAGYLTPSALIFFLLVGTGFAQPLMSLMISMAVLQYQIEAGLKNISEILDEPDLPSPEHPEFPEDFSIDIHDVSFAYEDGPTVLHEINLNIPEGTSLALVGPSGGGKSTLLGLLARF